MAGVKGRHVDKSKIVNEASLLAYGMTPEMIASAVSYTYSVLDAIDEKMGEFSEPRLSGLLELANLSSIVGNLFGRGMAKSSNGTFIRNKPHTYPDLLAQKEGCIDCEIKVALETNKPKGHLAKPGPHITVRYVLAEHDGKFSRGKTTRGDVVWIWEVRAGTLQMEHFNISNTAGDSGKTAVINAAGMSVLQPVYIDLARCPMSPSGALYRGLEAFLAYHAPKPPRM